jgi:hypothetical protein
MKVRIVERTNPAGYKTYEIQQKHFLFRWMWVDAWINSWQGASCNSTFYTLEDAKKHLCYFDGTKCTQTVVY